MTSELNQVSYLRRLGIVISRAPKVKVTPKHRHATTNETTDVALLYVRHCLLWLQHGPLRLLRCTNPSFLAVMWPLEHRALALDAMRHVQGSSSEGGAAAFGGPVGAPLPRPFCKRQTSQWAQGLGMQSRVLTLQQQASKPGGPQGHRTMASRAQHLGSCQQATASLNPLEQSTRAPAVTGVRYSPTQRVADDSPMTAWISNTVCALSVEGSIWGSSLPASQG